MTEKNRACPVERAGLLDNKIRRWIHNPQKILAPYIQEGMTVLDFGCGPGFFTIDLAYMVGNSGKVIASDLQTGMLTKLRNKIQHTDINDRIELHQCHEDKIGLSAELDFIVAFYVVHEVSDQKKFFDEAKSLLKPGGLIFMSEPPIHVSKSSFNQSVIIAENTGFKIIDRPKVFLGQTILLKKESD